MSVIWKWPAVLDADAGFVHSMPAGAHILTVQEQHGAPQVWAAVEPSAPQVEREFVWAGTGHPYDGRPGDVYVGSIQLQGGAFVFHLFARAEPVP